MLEYEQLQTLMDPSRNMKTYRSLLMNSSPPMIPFFPVLIKDLFFVHECNDSKIKGLVNFDKLRLMAQLIRFMDAFRSVQYEGIAQPHTVDRRRRNTIDTVNESTLDRLANAAKIGEFLGDLHVIDDMRQLSILSRDLEQSTTRQNRTLSLAR